MRGLRSAFLLAMPLAVAVACSSTTKTRGQLMVSVQTDLSIPKDIDSIGLFVYAGGTGLNLQEYQVGEASQQLPATFGIIQGSSPDAPVRIRLTGRKNGALLLLSEVITTVPSGRLALLRMPLQWLCLGQANEGNDTSSPPESLDGSATSKCTASEEMCVAGRCADENIDSSTLPDYDPTQIFGGASGPGESGMCLDTLGCFSTGSNRVGRTRAAARSRLRAAERGSTSPSCSLLAAPEFATPPPASSRSTRRADTGGARPAVRFSFRRGSATSSRRRTSSVSP